MLKYLLLCPKKKKNLIELNLIALKNDNIFCILLDMENWCLKLIEEPNILHLSIIACFDVSFFFFFLNKVPGTDSLVSQKKKKSFALSQNYYIIPFQFIATQKTFLITHCSPQFLCINSSL